MLRPSRFSMRLAAFAAVGGAALACAAPAEAQYQYHSGVGYSGTTLPGPRHHSGGTTVTYNAPSFGGGTYGRNYGGYGRGYYGGYGRGYYGRGGYYGGYAPVIGVYSTGVGFGYGGGGGFYSGFGYPGYNSVVYSPYYGGWNGNPTGSIYGPLTIPANAMFGPNNLPVQPPPDPFVQPAVNPLAARVAPKVVTVTKVAPEDNAARVQRADTWMNHGDKRFAEQAWPAAFDAYRSARTNLPDSAAVHFRLGWMGMVVGRYDLAAQSFRDAITKDPLWKTSIPKADDLYGKAGAARAAHQDALAAAARKERNNADLMLTLAVFLQAEGQPHRALPFAQRAQELTPSDGAVVQFTEFLRGQIPAEQ